MKGIFETLKALGPLGVFVLAILDSAGVPVVGGVDALLIFVSVQTPGLAFWVAASAVVGSVTGSLFLFWIARKGGEAYLDRHTASARGAKLRQWFQEYGLLTVFVPAATPIIPTPLKVFVLSAGALGVRPALFAAVMALARALRYFAIAALGLRLGTGTLPYLRGHLWALAAIAAALFGGLYIALTLADRRRKLARATPAE